jgi:hypothetical protein
MFFPETVHTEEGKVEKKEKELWARGHIRFPSHRYININNV